MISQLDTKIIGRKLYHFDTIDSTNTFAKILIKKGAEEGTVVVADAQSSGYGRKDRTWSSPKGGLWFSVVLYPAITPQSGMIVTMATSVAIAKGIEEITDIKPVIKWPNDLLINGKKACGVFTELDARKDIINNAVVGIGINVNNQIDEELNKIAVSLVDEVGTEISIDELLRSILINLDETYNRLTHNDYDFIRDSWLSYSSILGKKIQVQDDETVTIGKVIDVDEDGCLILDTENGSVKVICGDITYL
ncbi:MAG: biotin--[acetyl-CoA-carboxylase] ligase [Thermoplasmatales archaeon]|nr:biotin--[acetyl-CoA-carboxylase] ligase [Thermoplasmatales archaeon]